METVISDRSFNPGDLRIEEREPGISAFMRIRNGEDFLEVAIRSHIDFLDEIVAIHNQSTDRTREILSRLSEEFGENRLRVFHYTDRVFPPGSEGHAKTPPDSPNSFVNYSNMALAMTRFNYALKLDDDHFAIPFEIGRLTGLIRRGEAPPHKMFCISGLNLMRSETGRLGISQNDPISGSGDVGFFPVSSETHFVHDRRFEEFRLGGLQRQFSGFLYWHLKYLKKGMGFANYELEDNPGSRFHRHLKALKDNPQVLEDTLEVQDHLKTGILRHILSLFSEKARLINERNRSIMPTFGSSSIEDALTASVEKEYLNAIGIR